MGGWGSEEWEDGEGEGWKPMSWEVCLVYFITMTCSNQRIVTAIQKMMPTFF